MPCAGEWAGGDCSTDDSADGEAASAETSVLLPQLSGLFSLRIGRGGMFGTREASATFDQYGAPLTLEYGSTSGGDDIAGVIESGRDARETLRDARTDELNRRIARQKARQELEALLAE